VRHLHILGIAEPSSFGVHSPAARCYAANLVGAPSSPAPIPQKGPHDPRFSPFLLTPRALVPGFWGLPLSSGARKQRRHRSRFATSHE